MRLFANIFTKHVLQLRAREIVNRLCQHDHCQHDRA